MLCTIWAIKISVKQKSCPNTDYGVWVRILIHRPNPSQYPNHIYIEREKKGEGRGDKTSLEEKRVKYLKERVEINCHDSSRQEEIMSSKKRW